MSNTIAKPTLLTMEEIEKKTRLLWEQDEREVQEHWRKKFLEQKRTIPAPNVSAESS